MRFEPTKPLADLIMKHAGKRICVMGGAQSLDEDLSRIEADVWISVNQHGAMRRPVDYIVCMDNIHTGNKREMRHFLREFSDAPVISPWHWGQYQMHKWPGFPKLYNSGVLASWIAYLMGGHPVILAGFDCYGGDRRILMMHGEYVPEVQAEVRVASGPISRYYPIYDPSEEMDTFKIPSYLGPALEGQIKVRVLARFEYRGKEWPIGTILTVDEFEVRRQIKHKSLERLPDEPKHEPLPEPPASAQEEPAPKRRGRPKKVLTE